MDPLSGDPSQQHTPLMLASVPGLTASVLPPNGVLCSGLSVRLAVGRLRPGAFARHRRHKHGGSTPRLGELCDGHSPPGPPPSLSPAVEANAPLLLLLVGLAVRFLKGFADPAPIGHFKALLPRLGPDRLQVFSDGRRLPLPSAAFAVTGPRLGHPWGLVCVRGQDVDQLFSLTSVLGRSRNRSPTS